MKPGFSFAVRRRSAQHCETAHLNQIDVDKRERDAPRQFSKGQLLAPLVIALMRASQSIGRGSLDDPRIIARDARAEP
jgi:hypothetical protein